MHVFLELLVIALINTRNLFMELSMHKSKIKPDKCGIFKEINIISLDFVRIGLKEFLI